jgi:hypothetical protein
MAVTTHLFNRLNFTTGELKSNAGCQIFPFPFAAEQQLWWMKLPPIVEGDYRGGKNLGATSFKRTTTLGHRYYDY